MNAAEPGWTQNGYFIHLFFQILTVSYEDGVWSKPYYDCGGADIWMITYTVPFFGFQDGRYIFK